MMKVTTWLKNGLRREIALDQRASSDIATGVGVCWEDLFYPLDAGMGVAIASQPLLKNGPDEDAEEPLKPGPADFSVITVVAPEMLEDVDHVDADGTPFFYGFEGELLDLTHVWKRARLVYDGDDPFAATVNACNLEWACYSATSRLPNNKWKRLETVEQCVALRGEIAGKLHVPETWIAYAAGVYEECQTAYGETPKGAVDLLSERINTIIELDQIGDEDEDETGELPGSEGALEDVDAMQAAPLASIAEATPSDDTSDGQPSFEPDQSQLEDLMAQVVEDYPEEPDSWDNR